MESCEEDKILSLEQGRKLLENTALSSLNDIELQEFLISIKTFCEINFDMYLDMLSKQNMKEMSNISGNETENYSTSNYEKT